MAKTIQSSLRLLAILGLTLGLGIHWLNAAPGTLADSPLFLASTVKPNILMAIDDSGSMDSETLEPTNDGALWWNTSTQSFVGLDQNDNPSPGTLNYNQGGSANGPWKRYMYLFPNGSGGTTSGRRVYGDSNKMYVVPPTAEFAYTRSPDYNSAYYDPDVSYTPWVSYSGHTYNDADPTAAPFDAFYTGSGTLDLTSDFDATHPHWNDPDWQFRFYQGMLDTNQVSTISSITDKSVVYFPATYYRPAGTPDNTGYIGSKTCLNCLAPDGSLMDKYEIKPSNYDTPAHYQAAIKNFANWFTYYRRRHQAMRAGIGQAFDGQQNMYVGIFTINNRNNVTMLDMGVSADRDTFYDKLYRIVGDSGTPNRQAVDYMGELFATEGNNIIKYKCQQNFGILFTDGFSNASTSGYNVGNADGAKGPPYEDGDNNTMGDIAMNYFDTHMRPNEFPDSGQVPVPSACYGSSPAPWTDCNDNLHMNFYAVTLGSKGHIFGITHFSILDAYTNPPLWQTPNTNRDPVQIDDLYHGCVNGRGDLLNASTPAEIKTQMKNTLENIGAQVGSAAPISVSSTSLSSTTSLFLSQFDSATWTGALFSFPLNNDGTVGGSVWNAGSILTNRNLTTNDRIIISYNPGVAGNYKGVPFRWSNLPNTVLNDLRTDASGNIEGTDTNGQARLDFLRGKRDCEQGHAGVCSMASKDLRARLGVLGDIVHSSPVYVGGPDQFWPNQSPFPGTNTYSQFKLNKANRQAMVYVGGNDGMLHAFKANSGDELFAYVPSLLANSGTTAAGLHLLTEPGYHHKYYVDLTPTVSDAYISVNGGATDWHTVLVGGLRGGGRGLYALDVTDPGQMTSESTAKDKVMWEFTNPDLGHVFGQPVIVPLGDKNGIDWYVVVAGGYNDEADGGANDGQARLFLIKLSGPGSDGVWDENQDYYVISTGVGSVSDRNGIGEIQVVDYNRDNIADRVYAGDLKGNLWVFDISGVPSSTWPSNRTPRRLFVTDSNQPITGRPVVAFHPSVPTTEDNLPNLMVYFGSGQYLVDGDIGTTNTQKIYGVWDKGDSYSDLTTAKLVEQQIIDQPTVNGTEVRILSSNPVDYTSSSYPKFGWYINLPDTGERMVTNPLVVDNTLYFTTLIPSSVPCSFGGSGWIMAVDTATGGQTSHSVFDLNGDGYVNQADKVSSGGTDTVANGEKVDGAIPQSPVLIGSKLFTSNSKGQIVGTTTSSNGGADVERESWHQIPADRIK